uniref:Lysophosphatidylcholine acyltransferase 1 n=1 Tax=Eptatretus burgeri TaxID=7764 RepID=A0A8C4R5R8_EPTBU
MRCLWFVAGFHWICVKGSPAPPQRAPIHTIAPHSTYFDAIPVTMTMASIVAKSESQHIPLWGTLIKYVQPVFVSRDDPNSRRNTVEEIKRRADTKGDWPTVMIFPEGTCTNRTCLIKFKAGAFIPGVPVQPVVIRYPNKMDTVTWTWYGPAYLPVYEPSDVEKRDPNIYANNVRKVMARYVNETTIRCTTPQHHPDTHHRKPTQEGYLVLFLRSSKNGSPEGIAPLTASSELPLRRAAAEDLVPLSRF